MGRGRNPGAGSRTKAALGLASRQEEYRIALTLQPRARKLLPPALAQSLAAALARAAVTLRPLELMLAGHLQLEPSGEYAPIGYALHRAEDGSESGGSYIGDAAFLLATEKRDGLRDEPGSLSLAVRAYLESAGWESRGRYLYAPGAAKRSDLGSALMTQVNIEFGFKDA